MYSITAYLGLSLLFNVVDDRYVFERSDKIRVTYHVGGIVCAGTIDSSGCFKPDMNELGQLLAIKKANSQFELEGSRPKSLVAARFSNEPVYEYRSGLLIPMTIDEKRGLIPEVGEKIIDFKDYHYSPTARRIYNLPGRFVLKADEATKKP